MFRFIRRAKRRMEMRRVKQGDGHQLKRYRIWHILTRSLFHIDITNNQNKKTQYAIDFKYFSENPTANLYRNGIHMAYSKLPAAFPVDDGVIEIKKGIYGINRIYYATDKEETYSVYPEIRSIRGLRMWVHKRFPKLSSLMGVTAIVIILISFALNVPQLIETLSEIPWVSENIGTFVSPIALPLSVHFALVVAGLLAGFERTLMLRNHWLIDTMDRF